MNSTTPRESTIVGRQELVKHIAFGANILAEAGDPSAEGDAGYYLRTPLERQSGTPSQIEHRKVASTKIGLRASSWMQKSRKGVQR